MNAVVTIVASVAAVLLTAGMPPEPSSKKSLAPPEKSLAPAEKSLAPAEKSLAPAEKSLAPAEKCLAPSDKSLAPVPTPSLERMEPVVRDAFAARLDAVARLGAATRRDDVALAGAYADLGTLAMSYYLLEVAEACFANAAALDAGDYRWPYYLGALHQNERRPAKALDALRRALALAPGQAPALLRAGEALLLAGDLDAARRRFAAARDAGDAYAAYADYGLGRVAARGGDPAAAAEHFAAALAAQPAADAVHHVLGLAYRDLGDRQRAREHLARAGKARPTYPDPLIQGLVAEGAVAHMQRGLQAYDRGDLDAALEHYRLAVDADPDNPAVRREIGRTLYRLGRLTEAERHQRAELRLAPDSPLARVGLAQVLIAAGGRDQARALLDEAVAMAPGYAGAHRARGHLASVEGDHGAALEAFSRARALDPDDRRAALGEARALAALERLGDAVAALETLLAGDPATVEAALDLASLLARRGDAEGAAQRLRATLDAVEGRPQVDDAARAVLWLNLGNLLQGDPATRGDALAGYRRAVALDPGFRDARFNLAALLMQVGAWAEAAEAYAALVTIAPGDGDGYLGRAAALGALGHAAEARQALEAGLAAAPEHPALARALAHRLATAAGRAPDDGARALALAQQAFAARPTVPYAETVALALAAAGRAADAAAWQAELIDTLAREGAEPALLARLRDDLAAYRRAARSTP